MKKIYLHALPLRIWHWANAVMVIILLITGIQLRMSGISSLRPHDPALAIHNYAGWAMVVSYFFWFVYSLVSRNLSKHYAFEKRDVKGIFKQVEFYLFSIFKGEKNPFRPSPDSRFNSLQKIAYGAIMFVFAPLLVITGLLYTDTAFLRKYILLWNITGIINAVHIIAAYVFALFFIIHIYMATIGPSPLSHINAMIWGYEEEPDEDEGAAENEVSPVSPASETGSQSA
jgi:thiosulfate reductase cytochrome b subunit